MDLPIKWKKIDGYDGKYLISNTGLVMNNKMKILKQQINRLGEHRVALFDSKKIRHSHLVHRLVATYFVPNPNNFKTVIHLDGDITNNKARNLKWDNSYRKTSFKLDANFYSHLHKIEKKYGSIASTPHNDADYIAIQHIVGNC
ncbi:NUMOD4 domain-containing protein [Lactobacillus sp. PV034]|uniref:NUMOD4 domain-containing protein n=1 Tax=Lactobacillus sp. PV034 TaxID=2594495 RepID=UPI00223ED989|nr:NUMOD4 domain-containing protein [Lactobacillus sp. PV034]QNQ80796.1 hypothetical protein FP432_04125 [Lactobacillus sp. PV034]